MSVIVYDSEYDLYPSILEVFEIDDIIDLESCFKIIEEEDEWIGVVLK